MDFRKTGVAIPLIFFNIIGVTYPQSQQTLGYGPYYPRVTKIGFSRDLNVFEWNYSLNYRKQIDRRLLFQIRENFRSTLQSVISGDNWKDNQNLDVSLGFPIAKKVQATTSFSSQILIDPLDTSTGAAAGSSFDNDFNVTEGKIDFNYKPISNVSITPSVTMKWQTQLEQHDQGYGFGLDAGIDRFNIDDYKNDFYFSGQQVSFPQRKNHDLHIKYRIERQFYESTADTLNIVVDRLRRDSFGIEGGEVFVRNLTQTNRGFENKLSYRVADNATLFINNSLYATSFRVNNEKRDSTEIKKDDTGFESSNSFRFNYKEPDWFATVGWESRIKSREDNREDKTPDPFGFNPTVGFDTEDILVKLHVMAGKKITETDSIGTAASISKFQYETTNETNPNDHDQQKWHFTVAHAHEFSPDLKLVWRASAFLNHFVFISGSFSDGNNWERTFQLTPQIIYKPNHKFYFRQRFTVRAKYQTYDFDQEELSNRNSVNRQFLINNFSTYRLSNQNQIEFELNYELAEQGRLFFDLWRQTLALSWHSIETQILYKHRFLSGLFFSTGANIFRQTRWEHVQRTSGESEKNVQSRHTNYGPIFEISYNPNNTMEVVLSGNVQISEPFRRQREYIQNYDINLNWFF